DNKGLLETIDAVASVPSATLLVVGDGPLKNKAENRAKSLGISDRVTFAGWLQTNEDVARAVASGKIFVMNSKSEGGPRVALEAMAIGVPVIATRVGVMPDVIQDGINGVFVGVQDGLCASTRAGLLQNPRRS
ncbi:glycosyltransferase, partial [Lacticaseibacillus rhamnosus]